MQRHSRLYLNRPPQPRRDLFEPPIRPAAMPKQHVDPAQLAHRLGAASATRTAAVAPEARMPEAQPGKPVEAARGAHSHRSSLAMTVNSMHITTSVQRNSTKVTGPPSCRIQ